MSQKYDDDFKKMIVRLYLDEGRTIKSLTEEYKIGHASISNWVNEFRKECQTNPKTKDLSDLYEENRRLRKELAEQKKENEFLKKAAAFFAKEID